MIVPQTIADSLTVMLVEWLAASLRVSVMTPVSPSVTVGISTLSVSTSDVTVTSTSPIVIDTG